MALCRESLYTRTLTMNTAVLFLLFFLSPHLRAEGPASKVSVDPNFQRNLLLGNIIKSGLENLHFRKKSVDDDLSVAAFEEYLKFLDVGKRFLTQGDIEKLRKYEKDIDNQIVSGRLAIMEEGERLLRARVGQVHGYAKKRLKRSFNLNGSKQPFQLDVEKRLWSKDLNQLYRLWDQILLVDVIDNYLDLEEEQKEPEKGKKKSAKSKKNKEKKAPKLGPKELRTQAITRTEKRYLRVFERMLLEDNNDQLNKLFNAVTKIYDPPHPVSPPPSEGRF